MPWIAQGNRCQQRSEPDAITVKLLL
jgi:hypothetical protein